MANELDGMLTESERRIVKLRDELRLEEMFRDRLTERCRQHRPRVRLTPEALAATDEREVETSSRKGGHRPAGAVVAGSLISRLIGILKAESRPMDIEEITKKVQAQGFSTTAKSCLRIAVSSQLSHGVTNGILVRPQTGVYAIKPDSNTTQ